MTEWNKDATETTEQGFKLWLRKVNNIMEGTVFLSYLDLPDVNYFEMYEEGESPKEAAEYAIRYAQGLE